ncbi:ribonuclease P protein component [Patescibacteria group bacterium]|nr:MAG: ribonuclease P protein component [Patescibacteria group bacterium]
MFNIRILLDVEHPQIMLPAKHRLRKSSEIERVWKRGRSFFSGEYHVKALQNRLPHSRFAVVVGTSVSKRAVKRNRLKRRTREILRKHLSHIVIGGDFVVTLKKSALDADFAQLETALLAAFNKAGALRS